MRLTRRRLVAGLGFAAVVATVTSVSTFALAGDGATAAPVRLIVGFKPGADPATAAQTLSAWGVRTAAATDRGQQALAALGAQAVQVAPARSAAMIDTLRRDPSVAYVEVDHPRRASDVTPNDPLYTQGLQTELNQVNLPAAWQTTTGSPSVKIAVVDTGVTSVGDLTGAVSGGYDFVNNDSTPDDDAGHGTVVASLIAARGNDGVGMAGVCWQCTILPVKVLDSTGSGYDSTVAKGIVYAVNSGAQIINMSLGGPSNSSVLANAVAYANYKGVLVIAAAGNDGSTVRSYPAAYPDVLSVGATERDSETRAEFSNYSSATDHWVDVAAPGIVTGMVPDGAYATDAEGTSFSTPIVAGIAGLVKAAHPDYSGWSVQHALWISGDRVGGWSNYGRVDAAKALTITTDTTPPTATGISPGQLAKVRGVINVSPTGVNDNWSGPRAVDFYADGKFRTYDQTLPFSVVYNTVGRNGPVQLEMRVYDKAGNVKILNRTIIADNTAPAVRITKAPKNKAKVSGTVKIYYTGSDKYGIKNYQLLVNGKVVQTHTSTANPFTFVASKYGKNITVQVRAYDVAGNLTTTAKLSYHR